jgi:hypothetical protein
MLLLDVKKAFDSVWPDALLHKLIQGGCKIFLLARYIHSFLSGTTFQVSVGRSKSSVCNIPYDITQGAVLSSTLYNFFTSAAPTVDGCELATYVDDTAIFVSNSETMTVCVGLQSQLNSLTDYFKERKLSERFENTGPFKKNKKVTSMHIKKPMKKTHFKLIQLNQVEGLNGFVVNQLRNTEK